LNLIKIKPLALQEIAHILQIPLSSTSMHIQCLEEAHLVHTETQPGIRGSMRVCMCGFLSFHLEAYDTQMQHQHQIQYFDMPLGNYSRFEVYPACGLASVDGIIDEYDNPISFYSTDRQQTELLWFHHGFVEYHFPNKINRLLPLQEISFSMELCSEAPGYYEDWPSDITFSVNQKELGVYHAVGDFGCRRGKLTPDRWPIGRTQFGLLTTISIRETGTYINEVLVNPSMTLEDLALFDTPYLSLRIEVKEDAKHVGGINLFGEKYGDYPQAIRMHLVY
jgi:predicted transcriptional regulator